MLVLNVTLIVCFMKRRANKRLTGEFKTIPKCLNTNPHDTIHHRVSTTIRGREGNLEGFGRQSGSSPCCYPSSFNCWGSPSHREYCSGRVCIVKTKTEKGKPGWDSSIPWVIGGGDKFVYFYIFGGGNILFFINWSWWSSFSYFL